MPVGEARGMAIKVYLVVLPVRFPQEGQRPFRLLAAKLTQRAAQRIVDREPGAYIEKAMADKE